MTDFNADDKIKPLTYTKKHFSFSEYGGFFAFSNEQLEQQRKPNTACIHLAEIGLFLPSSNHEEIMQKFHDHSDDETRNEIAHATAFDSGIDSIIKYHLSNHECYLTGDIEPLSFLTDDPIYQASGVTWDRIKKVYHQCKHEFDL